MKAALNRSDNHTGKNKKRERKRDENTRRRGEERIGQQVLWKVVPTHSDANLRRQAKTHTHAHAKRGRHTKQTNTHTAHRLEAANNNSKRKEVKKRSSQKR